MIRWIIHTLGKLDTLKSTKNMVLIFIVSLLAV